MPSRRSACGSVTFRCRLLNRPCRIQARPKPGGRSARLRADATEPVPSCRRPARPAGTGASHPRPLARAGHLRTTPRPERRQSALVVPRRADHRQQPDGRPSRLGPHVQGPRSSATTRCSARTSAGRTASTARACGSRSTSSASWASPASATSRRYGIAEFVSLCKQRVLTYAALQTEQSIRLGMWMDWNDPDELRRLRDLLGRGPVAGHRRSRARDGPVTDTVEMIVGRLGMPELGGSLLHVQQREQRPHLGLPRRVPPARLAVQGPRLDALVRALRHGHQPDGDERGLPGPRGPRPDRPLPARRPAGRVAARLDDDALDADRERRRGGRPGPRLRPHPPGRRRATGSARARSRRRVAGPFEVLEERPGRDLVGWRYAGPFDELPAVSDGVRDGVDDDGTAVRAPRHRLGRGQRGRGHGHRPHRARLRRRGLPAGQGARPAGHRAARRGRPLPRRASAG